MKLIIVLIALFTAGGCTLVCVDGPGATTLPGSEIMKSAALEDMGKCAFLGIVHASWSRDECRTESNVIDVLVILVRNKAFERGANHIVLSPVERISNCGGCFELNAQAFYCRNPYSYSYTVEPAKHDGRASDDRYKIIENGQWKTPAETPATDTEVKEPSSSDMQDTEQAK